jgi:NarL family two-component system response regulator LiaR
MCPQHADSRKPQCIRVLIVDDHPGVRHALASVLQAYDDLELVGEAAVGEKAIPLCAEARPDVVLMDLVMPGIGGVAAIRIIRQRWPQIRVLGLTSFQELDLAQEAVQAGAICCLLKNVSASELAEAIRAAFEGRPISFGHDCAGSNDRGLLQAYADPELTPREQEILSMIVGGLSTDEIARRLTVNPITARFHVENVLLKLGVTSDNEAVAIALQHRLVVGTGQV